MAGALLVAVALTGRWYLQAEEKTLFDLQGQRANLQAQLSGLPGIAVAPANFVSLLAASTKVDAVSRDVGQFAQNLGVRVISMAIDSQASTSSELGRVQFNVSAQADYKNTKAWLAELLGRYPALGIQSLTVRAHPTDPMRQEIRVVLVLYVKD